MKTADELKNLVKEKYAKIADQSKKENEGSCCGSSCCEPADYSIMADDYAALSGYNPEADLGLGCGLPTEYARIKPGDTVVDLGSGAGNDCFVARSVTGAEGRVIGVDMTERMVEKAKINAGVLGFDNVEFALGDIENIPLPENTADVVVSNCVMNLVPDKYKAFSETFRILKPGGHFSISDITLSGELPEDLRSDIEMYVGCVAGAIQKEAYLEIIKSAGFKNITIQKEKAIILPKELISKYFPEIEVEKLKQSGVGVYSITVYGEK